MGQIADDIIDGDCCALCGCYFVKWTTWKGEKCEEIYSHTNPVACNNCWDKDCGYPKQDKKVYTL